MASKALVKRKASPSLTKTTKSPNFSSMKQQKLDSKTTSRAEAFVRLKREKVYPALVKELYANLSFSDLDGEIVGKSMLRGKKIDLTMKNLRTWIVLKEGDFKRYSTKEPISMEAYSHDKAVKKITGGISGEFILGQLGVNERLMAQVLSQMILPKASTSYYPSNSDIFLMWYALKGWEPDLAFIILNHMKDTLARPNADLPYGSLITIISRYRGVVNSKRNMNVKHGRQPPKTAGRRKSSRLLKKESPTPSTPSSPIQVSEEDKVTKEVDSDATMYSDSPTPPEKTKDTMHSSSPDKKPPQADPAPVTSQPSATDPASDHEPDLAKLPVKPPSTTSLKSSASSLEPTPAPLTPLVEIRAHLRSLTVQVTTALEEIQELKTLITEISCTVGNAGHPEPPTATPSSAP
ncbi:uncharacterized protein G2W53_035182 [Senna tora]|uniref:Putative plant transposon protein domain-containing protein n=1 Tax=Senna tora TaxID=362788 RepID=A0A834T350_9FABA|nr:uncharacterized protein G2W53_035182 [Senna tora]